MGAKNSRILSSLVPTLNGQRKTATFAAGVIETPGCISQYGGNIGQIPLEGRQVPPSFEQKDGQGIVGPGCYDYETFRAFGQQWVTGGYKTFQATENVVISNVRLNDIDLR